MEVQAKVSELRSGLRDARAELGGRLQALDAQVAELLTFRQQAQTEYAGLQVRWLLFSLLDQSTSHASCDVGTYALVNRHAGCIGTDAGARLSCCRTCYWEPATLHAPHNSSRHVSDMRTYSGVQPFCSAPGVLACMHACRWASI